jgi:hypothetical protein
MAHFSREKRFSSKPTIDLDLFSAAPCDSLTPISLHHFSFGSGMLTLIALSVCLGVVNSERKKNYLNFSIEIPTRKVLKLISSVCHRGGNENDLKINFQLILLL